MKGDLQAAFESIRGVPADLNAPRFFVYRASLLLAVGRVDEASKDIERALSLDPKYSDAFALGSIIAVAQNEKEKALEAARKAVETDPKSVAALIALSYSQQANFDLEGALDSLKRAVQVNPENAVAWARLSDLHMSFADLSAALESTLGDLRRASPLIMRMNVRMFNSGINTVRLDSLTVTSHNPNWTSEIEGR